MIDLHTHSIFSDGALIPSELVRRAWVKGYRAIAITDHADHANYDFIIPRVAQVARLLAERHRMIVIPGVEITHVHPADISALATEARKKGAEIIVVHGETLAEPVIAGTNRAALDSPIDVLAHPGLITDEEAQLAAKRSIFLEITTRSGHSLANGHVASMARKHGAPLVINTDSHSPGDLATREEANRIARGAGLTEEEISRIISQTDAFIGRICAYGSHS